MNSKISPPEQETDFRFLKQFNALPYAKKTACRDRLRESDKRWFPGDYLSSVFARKLCDARAIPFKEVLESFEFYACVRKHARATAMADLCCGHGLVGILFAMFERKVERVALLDRVKPASFEVVYNVAVELAPWVAEKVEYVVCPILQAQKHLEDGVSLLGVHACGERTDRCISLAIDAGGTIAVLPCCRDHRHPSPLCLKQVLGADVAIDVDRTYRLATAGYRVRWEQIPKAITPMNRVMIGIPQKS